MKGNYSKVNRKNLQPPNPKPGIDSAVPLGPNPPTRTERFASDHPWLAKAGAAVKERSAAVAKDMQRPNSYRGVKPDMGFNNPDPFGLGRTHAAAGRTRAGMSGTGFGRSPWGQADDLGIGDPFGIAPRPNFPKQTRRSGASTRTIYHPDGRVEVIHAGGSAKKKRRQRQDDGLVDPFHISGGRKNFF